MSNRRRPAAERTRRERCPKCKSRDFLSKTWGDGSPTRVCQRCDYAWVLAPKAAEAKLARVREWHRPESGMYLEPRCAACSEGARAEVPWPCPTFRALSDDDGARGSGNRDAALSDSTPDLDPMPGPDPESRERGRSARERGMSEVGEEA